MRRPVLLVAPSNKIDHHLAAQQRASAPVVGDVAEHAVLDLVPLLVPGGKWQT